MCESCDAAEALVNELITYPVAIRTALYSTISVQLPKFRFRDYRAYHILIGGTPDPNRTVDLDVPDIRNFIDGFRSQYMSGGEV
jgi:hypothetical protein